jgi:hypothetical protein
LRASTTSAILAADGAEGIDTGGLHHFGSDYGFLADHIARNLARAQKFRGGGATAPT